MINFPIDFVFPYLDNTKKEWQDNFKDYCIKTKQEHRLNDIYKERYDDFGLLKYLLRSIDRFASWINNLFIIVQDESQILDWLEKDHVKIVKHSDFIPSQYLPTYNSTTIEMFLWNIKDLNNHFIYSNDDLFFTNETKSEDFFTDTGKPKINIIKSKIKNPRNSFDNVCLKSYQDIALALGIYPNTYDFMRPEHCMYPLILSHTKKVFDLLQSRIIKNISAFRTRENYNQYLYTNYTYLTRNYAKSEIKFRLVSLENNIDEVINIIKSKEYQEICLNDVPRTDRQLFHSNIDKVKQAFEEIGLNKKSKYEV